MERILTRCHNTPRFDLLRVEVVVAVLVVVVVAGKFFTTQRRRITLVGTQVIHGEEFQYFDPWETTATLTTNCIRIFLHDGSIIVFRLCAAEGAGDSLGQRRSICFNCFMFPILR